MKSTAKQHGCMAGFASTERLKNAPPSGDPEYLLPGAQSVISLALPLNPERVNRFLTKKSWHEHCLDREVIRYIRDMPL